MRPLRCWVTRSVPRTAFTFALWAGSDVSVGFVGAPFDLIGRFPSAGFDIGVEVEVVGVDAAGELIDDPGRILRPERRVSGTCECVVGRAGRIVRHQPVVVSRALGEARQGRAHLVGARPVERAGRGARRRVGVGVIAVPRRLRRPFEFAFRRFTAAVGVDGSVKGDLRRMKFRRSQRHRRDRDRRRPARTRPRARAFR